MSGEREQLRLLGQAIRSVRDEHDFTITDLAARIGVPPARLRALEAGQLDPDYELLLRIAESLHTRPSTFVIRAEELGRRTDDA
jgi:transcriptional regulator with XRE-family HTH domain